MSYLNGASLDFVKTHLPSLGGKVNRNVEGGRVTVNLIKNYDDLPEDYEEFDSASEHSTNKSALIIPMSLMTSFMWARVCKMTGQLDLLPLRPTDAPSGAPPTEAETLELESTSNNLTPEPRLLVDISSIHQIAELGSPAHHHSEDDPFGGDCSNEDFDDVFSPQDKHIQARAPSKPSLQTPDSQSGQGLGDKLEEINQLKVTYEKTKKDLDHAETEQNFLKVHHLKEKLTELDSKNKQAQEELEEMHDTFEPRYQPLSPRLAQTIEPNMTPPARTKPNKEPAANLTKAKPREVLIEGGVIRTLSTSTPVTLAVAKKKPMVDASMFQPYMSIDGNRWRCLRCGRNDLKRPAQHKCHQVRCLFKIICYHLFPPGTEPECMCACWCLPATHCFPPWQDLRPWQQLRPWQELRPWKDLRPWQDLRP